MCGGASPAPARSRSPRSPRRLGHYATTASQEGARLPRIPDCRDLLASRSYSLDECVDRTETVERCRQRPITGGAAGPPLLEALHIEQGPNFRIRICHTQEQLSKLFHQCPWRVVENGEITVIVG